VVQRILLCLAAVTAVAASSGDALAKPVPPEPIPADRLLRNVTAFLHQHPNDANAYFTLGRIHYFLFATRRQTIDVFPLRGETERPPELYSVYGSIGKATTTPAEGGSGESLTVREAVRHLGPAILYLQKAIRLRDQAIAALATGPHAGLLLGVSGVGSDSAGTYASGLYELCLACVEEDGASQAPEVVALPGLKPTTASWRAAAIDHYWKAFQRSAPLEARVKYQPLFGLERLVSYEAGNSYVRMAGTAPLSPTVNRRVQQIRKHIGMLNRLPSGGVTPIVFSLKAWTTLAELRDDRRTVSFNLDGSGRAQHIPWVKSDTSILVWQPDGRTAITSGRQLFGNVTWWMFWQNGYQALDALDDDRNGWLSGRELLGLAVWCDRNGNGRSDPGEVTPVIATPIRAVRTHADGSSAGSPFSSNGLRLSDGRLLPTYDWTPAPQR